MWPIPAPAPPVERVKDRAVDPAGQLKPEVHKEQRELDRADGDDGLQIVGAHHEHNRNADHQRHLQQREHHGQCLAHHIEGWKGGDCAQGHADVAGGTIDDVG